MKDNEKLIYIIETCCMQWDDMQELMMWIGRIGLDDVYASVHYMFDEDTIHKT